MSSAVVEFDVLVQGSPVRDVDELKTTTDRQHRNTFGPGGRVEGELPLVTIRLGLTQLIVGSSFIVSGVDVGAATQHQSIEMGHDLVDVGVTRELHGYSPRQGHGATVVSEVQVE